MLKERKKNFPKKVWKPFHPWLQKGIDQKRFGLTEFAGAFKKFCTAEGIQVYSTMNETKAAFAERTIRSLRSFFYSYVEDFGYKYIQNNLNLSLP